jgi:hypothetical protein
MKKTLNEMSQMEIAEMLGLGAYTDEQLDLKGVEINQGELHVILRALNDFDFQNVRGHMRIEGLANVSYSSGSSKNRALLFYDYYQKEINIHDAHIAIDGGNYYKIYISHSNWIDIYIYKDSSYVTIVLVP